MSLPRSLLATIFLLAGLTAQAQIGITPISGEQDIPSGKTLVVPIVATDAGGPARTYTVSVAGVTGTGGINAVIRTGDPHLILGIGYTLGTGSDTMMETGTMEFQLLREFAPVTTQIIAGLAQGGFYSPTTTGTNPTHYITFHRVLQGQLIQGGDPLGNGSGGPGFTYPDEFNPAIIFSGTAGQLAMAHSGSGVVFGGTPIMSGTVVTGTTVTTASQGTDGSQFFITMSNDNRSAFDFGYTIFGQLLRGYDVLFGIGNVDVGYNSGLQEFSSPTYPVNITSVAVTHNDTDAVLLLSGTGICQAQVTVTAVSGTETTSQTFTADTFQDTVNDPPILDQPPDITAPNGTAKVLLSGTDLQFDLLRYGYYPILPFQAPYFQSGNNDFVTTYVTSGTSPLVSIPLVSNTDNTVAGLLDHWNATATAPFSPQGIEKSPLVRVFHIGAGDDAIKGTLASLPAGDEGTLKFPPSSARPVPLAVFTTANRKDTTAGFTASINWGDSTFVSGSDYTIAKDGLDRYELLASHTYSSPGEYPIFVNISDPGGAHLHLSGTANISGTNSGIAISGEDIARTTATLRNVLIATFKDMGNTAKASDYTATINWGDGALSPGVVSGVPGGLFRILGSHVYKYPATYTLSTTVTSGTVNGSHSYSGSVWTTAKVTGFTAPLVLPPFPQAHLAQVWSPVYSDSDSIVTGGSDGGGNPYAGLTTGTDGDLYGATINGGANGEGALYKITTSGSFTPLYSFTSGSDGGSPYAALATGTDGNLYGTTETDGSAGFGTIYQLTTSGTFAPIYQFTGGMDGGHPYAALVVGAGGLFYGTASTEGNDGDGVVFSVSTSGSFQTIHTFSGADGKAPLAALVAGTDGGFYGTTSTGGTVSSGTASGTVYHIFPDGVFSTVHTFTSGSDGGTPDSALTAGSNGIFYGTTATGGTNGASAGTIYQISSSGSFSSLYSFTGGSGGSAPYGALTAGTDGNLYGTTTSGGADGFGTVFSYTVATGSLTTLYSFTDGNDGAEPFGTLLAGAGGSFYGTTYTGGNGFGTIYQITPGSSLDSLHIFTSGSSFQFSIRGSVAIINSGNKTSSARVTTGTPASFSVYLGSGLPPDPGILLTSNGNGVFDLPALKPGQSVTFSFPLNGSTDFRLKIPVGVDPTGLPITGVVNYTDPVGDYDGAEKTYSPVSY
jgi:uncharacterized repeat protein (TIGR03803 family)